MTICLKQILFHQEQLKSNLKELFSHFGKYVKQYTNIFAEVGGLLPTVTTKSNGLMNSETYLLSTKVFVNQTFKIWILEHFNHALFEFVCKKEQITQYITI